MTLVPGDLLSIEQVRCLLPLGRSSIYALIENGELPYHRFRAAGGGRGRIFVHRADLEAYVVRARQTAPRPATRRVDVDGLLKKVRRA